MNTNKNEKSKGKYTLFKGFAQPIKVFIDIDHSILE